MLKRDITYINFNDEEATETFYFNISKLELVDLEVEEKGGFEAWLKEITKEEDRKRLWEKIKQIVLLSYGQKSEDGKRFIKSPEFRTEFSQTAAFDALMTELITNAEAAAAFMMGVMPRDLAEQIDQDKPKGPPPQPPMPPSPPTN